PGGHVVATFWPAAGVGLVLLAFSPTARWLVLAPLLAVAGVAGDLAADRGVRLSVAHGTWEALALVGAALLVTRGGHRRPRLRDQEDLVRLVAAALGRGGGV